MRILWHLLHDANPESAEPDLQRLERILDAANLLNLNLALDRAQELYFHWVQGDLGDQCFRSQSSELSETLPVVNATTAKFCWSSYQLRRILALGKKLAVDVTVWSEAIGETVSS